MEKQYIEIIDKIEEIDTDGIFNINIGILGHVDSGKTSLAKRLSTIASTASFDKNPQSKEREITLDLGISAFYIKCPVGIKERFKQVDKLQRCEVLQVTLVDCPGHASLIRTVVAGASIIDGVLLVIDSVKGVQTQTMECLVLAEILNKNIVIALNKVDLVDKGIETKVAKLRSAFGKTKFGIEVPIVQVSATTDKGDSMERLIAALIESVDLNSRLGYENAPFLFNIDHCFAIKNKGTIITGTVLNGQITKGDNIYFPELKESKAVKGIQMFKKDIKLAVKGDRVGMLVKGLEPNSVNI